jgi:serine/threonine-protein kinase RsbW
MPRQAPNNDDAPKNAWSATVPPGSDAYRDHEKPLLDAVERAGYPAASVFAIRLAFEEAMMNAFKHGGGKDEGVDIEISVKPERVEITVDDKGPGFDPDDVPDPLAEENIELPSGRGLMLMRQYMTEVRFNPRGNRVTMVYERP